MKNQKNQHIIKNLIYLYAFNKLFYFKNDQIQPTTYRIFLHIDISYICSKSISIEHERCYFPRDREKLYK
ncbi:MAG: hypothetical protein RLZZ546_836, partial [Bacteroidota bacterium]